MIFILKSKKIISLFSCFVLTFAMITFKGNFVNVAHASTTKVDSCDNTSGWTGFNTITVDSSDKKEGAGALTRTGNGTDWFQKIFSTAVNSGVTESNGYLHLWLYVSDNSKINGGQIEITSAGSPDKNEYSWSLTSNTVVNGWNELNLKISNANKMGTPNLNAINFIRVYSSLTASITCKIDQIYLSDNSSTTSDILGKVYVGYQGWFTCYGDGSPVDRWSHWSGGKYQSDTPKPGVGNLSFELYPDVREYTSTFQTNFANLGNGQPAKLFSSYTDQTVNKHFEWMQTYGIDGAALQRFGSELSDSVFKAHRDSIANKVKAAAEARGRKFYIMYDISGMGSDFDTKLEADWTNTIKGTLNLIASPAYAKDSGKPVVCIWGLGFTDRPGDASQSLNLINWFKSQGCYVIGGIPTNWRTCTEDSKPGFQDVYKALNMISPWTVGRFGNIGAVDSFKTNYLQPDLTYCQQNGIQYQPVMFPGFAWSNWNGGTRNQIPRQHGDFMWRQAYDIKSLGISNGYVAMFDEYDEGTAIAKAAENSSMIPSNQYFLTLNADGVECSSDFYLRLTNDITKMIKGQINTTESHPTMHK